MFYNMFAVDITDTIAWQFVLYFDDWVANSYKLHSQNACHFHFCCWHCQHVFITIRDWVLASCWFILNKFVHFCTICYAKIMFFSKNYVFMWLFTFTSYKYVQNLHFVISEVMLIHKNLSNFLCRFLYDLDLHA